MSKQHDYRAYAAELIDLASRAKSTSHKGGYSPWRKLGCNWPIGPREFSVSKQQSCGTSPLLRTKPKWD
jgi:hypothetical protein